MWRTWECNEHFLLACPRYNLIRENFLNTIRNHTTLLANISTDLLLFESRELSVQNNTTIFKAVQEHTGIKTIHTIYFRFLDFDIFEYLIFNQYFNIESIYTWVWHLSIFFFFSVYLFYFSLLLISSIPIYYTFFICFRIYMLYILLN